MGSTEPHAGHLRLFDLPQELRDAVLSYVGADQQILSDATDLKRTTQTTELRWTAIKPAICPPARLVSKDFGAQYDKELRKHLQLAMGFQIGLQVEPPAMELPEYICASSQTLYAKPDISPHVRVAGVLILRPCKTNFD